MANKPEHEDSVRLIFKWLAQADGCMRQALHVAQQGGDEKLVNQCRYALENFDFRLNAVLGRAKELGVNING